MIRISTRVLNNASLRLSSMVFFADLCPNREFSARLGYIVSTGFRKAPEAGRPSGSVTILVLRSDSTRAPAADRWSPAALHSPR